MADVFDVAAYILSKAGSMTAMKMQKLLYYAQAWSLVWDDAPLFDARFEAWANGPVSPVYFAAHKGEFVVSSEPKGDAKHVRGAARDTVDAILKSYGDKTPEWLSDRTHRSKRGRGSLTGKGAAVKLLARQCETIMANSRQSG
jgi:uncharacterized phage-associated protein